MIKTTTTETRLEDLFNQAAHIHRNLAGIIIPAAMIGGPNDHYLKHDQTICHP
jgi:hypothetical protein